MSPRPGVILQRTLDDRSPSRRFDAKSLQREIEELERAVAPARLVTAVKRNGPLLEVAVLAASASRKAKTGAPAHSGASSSVTAWRPNPW